MNAILTNGNQDIVEIEKVESPLHDNLSPQSTDEGRKFAQKAV